MLFPIICLVIIYLQTGIYARSIDSMSLDQLIESSLKQSRPVIIVMDPLKSLRLSDFGKEDSDERIKDVRDTSLNILRETWNQDRRVEDCKKFLRELLERKCTDEAKCTEVVWEVANKVCEETSKKT